jgi:hypothetical protein
MMEMTITRVLIMGLSVVMLSCSSGSAPVTTGNSSAPSAAHSADEPEIYEAVFRYQFDHNASAVQQRAERFCLSLPGERMPSAGFLRRFDGHHPPAVADSQCSRGSRRDLFFRIQKLDWRKANEVWVRGGYWEGSRSSSTESYRVVLENGKWVVKGARMEMRS